MLTRPEFRFDRPFTVSVLGGLVWGGRRYQEGEPFPWGELGVANEDLWSLWTQFQVDNVPPAVPPTSPPAKPESAGSLAEPAAASSCVEPAAPSSARPAAPSSAASPPPSSPRSSSPAKPLGITKPPQQNRLPRR